MEYLENLSSLPDIQIAMTKRQDQLRSLILLCFYNHSTIGILLSCILVAWSRFRHSLIEILKVLFSLIKFLSYLHGSYEKWNPRAKVDINAHWKKSFLRAWLPGEFQPRLKFGSAHRAEMLLWLHAQFQPGRKTQISVRKFTEVWKHSQCAFSRSFFGPRWNSVLITWDSFRFLRPFGKAENTGLEFSARAESLAM